MPETGHARQIWRLGGGRLIRAGGPGTHKLEFILEAEQLCEGRQRPQRGREGLQQVVAEVQRGQLLQGPDRGGDRGQLVVTGAQGLETYQSADPVSKFCQLIRVELEGREEGESGHLQREGRDAVRGEREGGEIRELSDSRRDRRYLVSPAVERNQGVKFRNAVWYLQTGVTSQPGRD